MTCTCEKYNQKPVVDCLFVKFRPSNSHGLTVTLTVWDAISRSHGFAFKSHGEPKTSKLPKKILHRLENMKE